MSFGGSDAESEEMDEGSKAGHEHEDVDNQEQYIEEVQVESSSDKGQEDGRGQDEGKD